MNPIEFHSTLAAPLHDFVQLRRLGGSDYGSQARLLRYFDRFLCQVEFQGAVLPPDLVLRYLATTEHLHPRTRYNRFCVLRQFCRHLAQSNPLSYIPDDMLPPTSQTSRPAYIFTHAQIHALLQATRRLSPPASFRPQTYETLLGLLYTTGLRIGEALRLNLDDLDFDHALLQIQKGKFRKARTVPFSPSTSQALRSYVEARSAIPPYQPEAPLFLNLRNRRLRYDRVQTTFKTLLRRAGFPGSTDRALPRLHDLRHTFAIHRLLAWYREGKELYAYLPALATYLGHVNIGSTQPYIEPTPELLHEAGERFANYCREHILPKGATS